MNPTAQTKEKVSSEQFFALADTTNDRLELIDGEVLVMPSPTPDHQTIVLNVALLLRTLQLKGRIFTSPIDVQLDEENVAQPDALWIAPDGQCRVTDRRLVGAPDLMVEVFSPRTARIDKREKFALYERVGVREYWMLDPVSAYLEAYVLDDGHYKRLGVFGVGDAFVSPVLNQNAIDLSLIFDPDPQPKDA